MGLSALGTGLLFIGVLRLFFPGLVALVGLSGLVWIIGFASSVVGVFFIHRSYKNLKTGSVSDAKRYILEIMGYDKENSDTANTTKKVFNIIERNIDNIALKGMSKNIKNENKKSKRRQTQILERQKIELNCYGAAAKIAEVMNRYQNILIFNIVYNCNPAVNDDKYNIDLSQESEAKKSSIARIVQDYTKRLTAIENLSSNGYKNKLNDTMDEMLKTILSREENDKIQKNICDAAKSAKKEINKILSNFGLLGNDNNTGRSNNVGNTFEFKQDETVEKNKINMKKISGANFGLLGNNNNTGETYLIKQRN